MRASFVLPCWVKCFTLCRRCGREWESLVANDNPGRKILRKKREAIAALLTHHRTVEFLADEARAMIEHNRNVVLR